MRPFNLQEALAGKPVVTREGKPAIGLHVFPDARYQGIHAVVEKEVVSFSENGQYWNNGTPNKYDLFMASEKKEGWVNVYRYVPRLGRSIHATKEEALRALDAEPHWKEEYIATTHIEWEE
jgi:hypothetical protein